MTATPTRGGAYVRYLAVTTGWFGTKRHMIPVDDVRAESDGDRSYLVVPYTKDQLRDGPTHDRDEDFTHAHEEATTATTAARATGTRSAPARPPRPDARDRRGRGRGRDQPWRRPQPGGREALGSVTSPPAAAPLSTTIESVRTIRQQLFPRTATRHARTRPAPR